MRVAVAGATGVLGRALIPQLLAAGHQVLGLVRNERKAQELFAPVSAGLEFAEADLLERGLESRLPVIFAGCDAVIQAATAIPPDPTAPGAWDRNTQVRIRGTGRLQRAALEANVGTFLLQSIVMAYPDGGDEWLDETTHIDSSPARHSIAHPVAIMESMMYLFRRQPKPVRWCILKVRPLRGRGYRAGSIADATACRARSGPGRRTEFCLAGERGRCGRRLCRRSGTAEPGSVYNICDEPLRYGDYVDRLAEMIHAPQPRRDSSKPCPPSWRCTNQRALRELGWAPKHSIWPRVTESVGGN